MPGLQTRTFGALEYDEAAIVEFPNGLPGFDDLRYFLLLEEKQVEFLQSVELPELCFATLPIQTIEPAYRLELTQDDEQTLALLPGENRLCLAILAPSENGRVTANLLAPIVINPRTQIAVQAVRADRRYSASHALPEAG